MVDEMPRLEPLDYGGILDRTFDLYARNFWLFVAVEAAIHVPIAVVHPPHSSDQD